MGRLGYGEQPGAQTHPSSTPAGSLTSVTRLRLFVIAALSSWLSGCSAPRQQGMIEVAPGAEDRFLLAMKMGYIGTFDKQLVPGQVRRALLPGQLPEGKARGARVGDYVLENGHVLAAITDVDGSERGGRLVDLARKPASMDGLDRIDLDVLGAPIVYDTLKTGFDDATQAAYVEVSGTLDRSAIDGTRFTVSTRYDAAPGVEAIVVHTHIKLEEGNLDTSNVGSGLLDERLYAKGASGPIVDSGSGFGASLGGDGAYLLRPLFEGARVTAAARGPRLIVDADSAPGAGDAVVITRMVAPLERSDTGALAVAVAKSEGRRIGDVEVRVAPRGGAGFPSRGDLAFVGADGARVEVCDVDTSGEDSHFAATLPAGRYTVTFNNQRLRGEGAEIEIEPDRVSFLTVVARPKKDDVAPDASACITAARHAPTD